MDYEESTVRALNIGSLILNFQVEEVHFSGLQAPVQSPMFKNTALLRYLYRSRKKAATEKALKTQNGTNEAARIVCQGALVAHRDVH